MTIHAGEPDVVRLSVTNHSSKPTVLVLEPAGEIYRIEPTQSRIVRYIGDPTPRLSIDVHDGETRIWEEGSGTLTLEE